MTDTPKGDEEPYIVTRGKPPLETRFKPGKSGNPKGRPKGSKQIDTLMEEELDRKIPVTLSGRRTMLSKRQVMIRQLVDKALKGDHKAITTCLALQTARSGTAKGAAPEFAQDMDALLSHDEQILMTFLERSTKEMPGGQAA